MDTGAYMANQIDDQIEASKYHYDEFCDQTEKEITTFIKECGYTFDTEHIFTEYSTKYSKGYYVSFTTKFVIQRFEEKLKLIYGLI
jgi:hypothetical protein